MYELPQIKFHLSRLKLLYDQFEIKLHLSYCFIVKHLLFIDG